MGFNFTEYNQMQTYLLPPSILDWVKKDGLAAFISQLVEMFDQQGKLNSFYNMYRKDGKGGCAYHPKMMLKIWLYSYAVGVSSSRKVAKLLESDINYKYMAANQIPDFRTISDFRRIHLDALDGLFTKVLSVCCEAGLVKLGHVALDGTKIKANAALEMSKTLDFLKKDIAEYLNRCEKTDKAEDEEYGEDKRGDELPEGFRREDERLKRIKEAMERLESKQKEQKESQEEKIDRREQEEKESGKKKRGRKPKNPDDKVDKEMKANETDPDSRIMKTRKGFVQGYNGQAMAEEETQIIVAQSLTNEENDQHQLEPMMETCREQAGGMPSEISADAGYCSETNLQLETGSTELYIATKKDHKQREELKTQTAPLGGTPDCSTQKERMDRKLLTPKGKKAYSKRMKTIEPVFGQIKNRGLDKFLLRGLKKVRVEWSLFCTSHNLLKLWRSGYKTLFEEVMVTV